VLPPDSTFCSTLSRSWKSPAVPNLRLGLPRGSASLCARANGRQRLRVCEAGFEAKAGCRGFPSEMSAVATVKRPSLARPGTGKMRRFRPFTRTPKLTLYATSINFRFCRPAPSSACSKRPAKIGSASIAHTPTAEDPYLGLRCHRFDGRLKRIPPFVDRSDDRSHRHPDIHQHRLG
jgi:hypothetical protein